MRRIDLMSPFLLSPPTTNGPIRSVVVANSDRVRVKSRVNIRV